MSERLDTSNGLTPSEFALSALKKVAGVIGNMRICVEEGLEACFLGAPSVPTQRQPDVDQTK